MYKNSKFTIILPIVVAVSVVFGIIISNTFIFKYPTRENKLSSRIAPSGDKINMLLSLIESRYVDPISMDSLTEVAIPQILADLDPHSVYIPAKDMADANEPLEGEFDGIGVVFNMATDTVIVLNVIGGGPSDKAGIIGRDRIITINDSVVAGVKMDQENVVKMLRGPRGSKVNLGIQRIGIDELIPITVTRGIIPIKSITAAYVITPKTGFIKFARFARTSYDELMDAISKLQMEGMQKLILDIRGNSGGYLDQAIIIANEFLAQRKLIVYTKDRTGNESKQYSNGRGRYQDMEIALLIDEGSASSSEILAGALQDNDRGMLVGRRTFGKGSVQEPIMFSDGSAIRLTIARYYTPTGRSIQKPYSNGKEEYYSEVYIRYQHDEFYSADSIQFADSLKYTTPGGRTVYGGGGIMPDVFVPLDTVGASAYFREVVGKNILYRYTIDYSDRNRDALNGIRTIADLDAFFAKDPEMFEKFIQYAAREGVEPNRTQINYSKDVLMAQLKAYIGRNTSLEDNAFYHSYEKIDNTVQKALEIL